MTPKAPLIITWRHWIRAPKRRQNFKNLLWLASAWNYNRNVIMVAQDSRLLLVFKILYYFFYSCYKKDFSKSWQFLVFQDVFKAASKRFQDVLEDEKLYVLEDKELFRWRRLQDVLDTKKGLLLSFLVFLLLKIKKSSFPFLFFSKVVVSFWLPRAGGLWPYPPAHPRGPSPLLS